MTARRLCASLMLALAMRVVCVAQQVAAPRILVGPTMRVDGIVDRSNIPVFGETPDCGVFATGSGLGISLGAGISIPSLFSNRFGLSAVIGGRALTGTFHADPVDPVRIFDRDNERLVELQREYRLHARMIDGYLDLLGRYHLTDHLSIAFGATLGCRITSSFSQSDNVLGPGDYAFSDGQREHAMPVGSPLTQPRLYIEPMLRASYELPLHSGALLVPELDLRANPNSAVLQASWHSYAIGGGLSILFDVAPGTAHVESPTEQTPEPPIEPVVVVAQKSPKLSASITLYGVDENNHPLAVTKVHVNEVLYRQYAPLLPAVFYDHDSAWLPSRYASLLPAAADSFGVDLLAGLDILDIQHYALDIVGERMRENPGMRITLIGSTSKDEAATLARVRAERVRSYLETTWGIARSRMAMQEGEGSMQRSNEATEDGRADNRRVEIVSSGDELLRPVVTEQIVRDFDPPIIKMNPSYEAEAGMKRWTLTITQGENIIAKYSNLDEGALTAPELTWRLAAEKIDSALDPLVAELTVEDSTGAKVTARNQVALSLERRLTVVDGRVARNGDREQISYNLVGFDYNTSELGRQNESTLREIAALVRNGSHVTVTGYTDRTGEEQRNVELSAKRASRVAALLRSRIEARALNDVAITSTGGGIETARFENNLPEGRLLSRGVSILIDQAIDDAEAR